MNHEWDSMRLVETYERILHAHPVPAESDPRELFAALCQAVAVSSILR